MKEQHNGFARAGSFVNDCQINVDGGLLRFLLASLGLDSNVFFFGERFKLLDSALFPGDGRRRFLSAAGWTVWSLGTAGLCSAGILRRIDTCVSRV
jgi:hypothetical protein